MAKKQEKKEEKIIKKTFEGRVVSNKSDKTIVVEVKTTNLHPKYLKRYIVTKKYKVHDQNNEYKVGETVTFVECRPISKDKCWRVLPRTKKNV